MKINNRANLAVISIDNLSDIFIILGAEGKKTAISRAEKCISETLGKVCDIYHIKDNVFVCVSIIDIRGYISQFKDAMGFSEIKEKYQLKVTVKYENGSLYGGDRVKDIKSKPKEVKRNTHSLKTNGGYKSKKTAMPMSAADSLKRQYVKTKAELKKQTEEQNERPENYAVEEVEDRAEQAAYAAADTVRQSAQYAVGQIKQRKAQEV